MATTISTEELKKKIDTNDNFHFVDVLSEASFESMHIPGSVNVPVGSDTFLERFKKETGAEKNDEIIVYCSSNTCNASVNAASALEQAGYNSVVHYAGGLAGWKEAGHALEGTQAE